MKMEMYWPQHKVFFIATLVLFPNKLSGHEVNQWFYTPYFVGKDLNHIEIELEEYRKAGYLKYEKSHALYKISNINTQKATDDLMEYLRSWQQNKLEVLSAAKPPDYEYQQKLLLDAVVYGYTQQHQEQPRIKLADIFGSPDDYDYEPPFWELALAFHLLDHRAEIISMGYDQRKDGLYEASSQPFIEYRFTDKKLLQWLKAPHNTSTEVLEANSPASHGARVILDDKGFVRVKLDNDTEYQIKKLRYEGAPYNFLRYVLDNPNKSMDITEIHDRVRDCRSKQDMTELVRQCGFNETLKESFFVGTTRQKVRLTQNVTLNSEQLDLLKNGDRK